MCFDTFEGAFEAEPEIDFLGCSTRGDVPRKFGDGLDGFNPGVDVSVEGVEEGAVVKEFRRDMRDIGAYTRSLSL